MISSAAQSGNYGCSIWFNTFLQFGANDLGAVKVKRSDLAVILSEPRRLIVKANLACGSFCVACLHAPWNHPGEWWTETAKLIVLLCGGLPLIICMDANTQVCCTKDDIVGDVGVTFIHASHDSMRTFLEDCAVWLPATFDRFAMSGVAGTYHTSLGMVRIDYIGLSGKCNCVPKSACSWLSFDMMNKNRSLSDSHQSNVATEG